MSHDECLFKILSAATKKNLTKKQRITGLKLSMTPVHYDMDNMNNTGKLPYK